MPLINFNDVTLSYDGNTVLDNLNLTINDGERVALVGRNGSGKSTLLKLMAQILTPDSGTVSLQKGIRSAYLEQLVPGMLPGTVYDIVRTGLSSVHDNTVTDKEQEFHHRTEKTISQLELKPEWIFNDLSAGLKRKVLLAEALISEPDILLLDEPTNHMDVDSISRFEEMLLRFTGAVVLVTHDRVFLKKIAVRIIEIDRGTLFDQSCDYETFLERREAARENELARNAIFDKKIKQEEIWLRQGISARRTRNEGRVRELLKMRKIREERKNLTGTITLTSHNAGRSGNLVVRAENLSFSYGEKKVISDLNTVIMKGDKVGILGPNGSGKTTLLRLLLGEIKPDSGSIRLGTNRQVNYFDQLREQLDEKLTVQENVAEANKDMVIINGKPRHIIGYLGEFLFSPEQIRSCVSTLSGGERNRLLLARLFTHPSNIIILDEPTNDLDIESMEILEEYLINYKGTVILVSHDREFINNVVTSTLVFEGDGRVREYVGGYDDWLRQTKAENKPPKETRQISRDRNENKKSVFGFRQQKELEALPLTIEAFESEQDALFMEMSNPDYYRTEDKTTVMIKKARLETIKTLLADSYARWEELERLRAGSRKL